MTEPTPEALAADIVQGCQHANNPHLVAGEWTEMACGECIARALTTQAQEIEEYHQLVTAAAVIATAAAETIRTLTAQRDAQRGQDAS